MDRVILHSDLNNFYASVECLYNPELRGHPVAVCGDPELRHGIVLAKNYEAKAFGIKTGDVIWEARQKCRNLIVVPANFKRYIDFSRRARRIYEDYTDQIESFGIDECWLDVTHSRLIKGDGVTIAQEIRQRMKEELGVTVSIGVSWNKIFAKLGSDMKKPDAVTVITKQNYKDIVFPLPAEDLLYVGRATKAKLNRIGVMTIGDLATMPVDLLQRKLHKWGLYLWTFANGYDDSPVAVNGAEAMIKSVGNSTTTIRDLETVEDVEIMVTIMAESVAARLREQWLKGQVVHLYVRDKELFGWGKQVKIQEPTFVSHTIADTAMQLFRNFYDFRKPLRSVGVKVSDLTSADQPRQTDLFIDEAQKERADRLEIAVDEIRRRFGFEAIKRGLMLRDTHLSNLNPKDDNTIHPYSFFR